MKKKGTVLLLTAVLLVCLWMGIWVHHRNSAPEDALVPMVMVDGTVWQLASESEGGFSRKPDGNIREIIGNQLPVNNDQANFGEVGMPYWKLSDGVLVYVNGKYFIMTNAAGVAYER